MTSHPASPGDPSRSSHPQAAAGTSPRPVPAAWRVVLRGLRLVLAAAVAGTALLGAVVTHWLGMLVVAPALGAVLAAVVALLDPSARRGLLVAGAAGVVLVPFANGLVLLGTAGGGLLLGLLCLAPLLALEWAAVEDGPRTATDRTALRELLPLLPTGELLEEWRASGELLRSPADRADAAAIRALLLDELSRRDPDGVAGWLAAGGAAPDRYIRVDRDLAG